MNAILNCGREGRPSLKRNLGIQQKRDRGRKRATLLRTRVPVGKCEKVQVSVNSPVENRSP